MSVSAAKPSDGGATRRFSRPFKRLFCNTAIGHDQPYFRLDDPRGRLRQNKKTVMSVYFQANGAKCVGKKPPSGSNFDCAGCGEAGNDVRGVMGAGQASHMFCRECKFDKRADLLAEVQTQIEKDRIAREADAIPRKTQRDPDTTRNVKKRRLSLNKEKENDEEEEEEGEEEEEEQQQPTRASKRRRRAAVDVDDD